MPWLAQDLPLEASPVDRPGWLSLVSPASCVPTPPPPSPFPSAPSVPWELRVVFRRADLPAARGRGPQNPAPPSVVRLRVAPGLRPWEDSLP